MATFAKIGPDGIVEKVISVDNKVITDSNGIEQEQLGVDFLKNLYNEPNAVWKQTSYNTFENTHKLGKTPFRKNHAGVGFFYDAQRDAFIPPKIVNSYIFDENTCTWKPPIPYPETYIQNKKDINGDPVKDVYFWDDISINWKIQE